MNALTTRIATHNAFYNEVVCADQVTMSSREIADLTGKLHHHVIRDIRTMLEELGEVETKFGGYYTASNGKQNPEYHLPKDLTITLVSGYNVQMRYAITKRWMELEEQVAAKSALPTTYLAALEELVQSVKEKEALRLENEAMKPDAEVGQAVSARKRTTIMDFARKLPGVNTMQVQNTLADMGHMRKRMGAWAVYAASKQYFTESFDHRGYSVITLTDKGMQLLSRLYLNGEFPMLKGKTPVTSKALEGSLNAY